MICVAFHYGSKGTLHKGFSQQYQQQKLYSGHGYKPGLYFDFNFQDPKMWITQATFLYRFLYCIFCNETPCKINCSC